MKCLPEKMMEALITKERCSVYCGCSLKERPEDMSGQEWFSNHTCLTCEFNPNFVPGHHDN